MINDFEIGLPSKLPTEKDDLFCFSFNFENLIKTIDYLHKYNLALFSKMQNLNERMIKIEEINPKIQEEIKNLQKDFQNSSNKHENKINDLSKEIEKSNIKINENKKLIGNNKENIDKLFKEINEIKNKPDNKNKKENKEEGKINFDEIKKFLSENAIKGNNDKKLELINHKVNELSEKINTIQINSENSHNQKKISYLASSLEHNGEERNEKETIGNSNLFKITMAEIEKNKKNSQDKIAEFKTFQDKMKEDILRLSKDLAETKTNYQNLLKSLIEEKKYFLTFKDIKDISGNVDIITSKLNEYSLKTDLDSFQDDFYSKFQKIMVKLKELENENKKKNNIDGWDPEDLNFVPVTKRISGLVSDLMKTEGKNIDLTKNKHFIELQKLNRENTNELNKNMKNYLDLKSLISLCLSQNDLFEVKNEINEIKKELKANKGKLRELIKIIGSEEKNDEKVKNDEEEKNEKMKIDKELKDKAEEEKTNLYNKLNQNEETIKGKIEFLTDYVEDLSGKLMKAEKKISSFTKDLKNDMKANLRVDTFKVMEQFKLKLNSFADKFENELKNKIDQIGLNSFENKLNSKLTMDLKDKLNKKDLKKNNFMINKKIDTLENKISKTLVDTIIDLQMDDAPLLIKKNQKNVELCASCNRPFNENNCTNLYNTIDYNRTITSTFPNNFMISPRLKIKNVSSLKKLPVITSPPK